MTETLAAAVKALRDAADLLERAAAAEIEAPPADQLLTVEEIAAILRRSARFVRTQCHQGAITAVRDGRGYRARRSAVEAYIRRRTV